MRYITNKVSCVLALFPLAISSYSYSYFEYSEDLADQFGEFEGTELFNELDSQLMHVNNHAEVVINNSSGSKIVIDQTHQASVVTRQKWCR